MDDEWYKRRLLAITEQMLASRVARGEVNPDDPEALRDAARQAVSDARQVLNAALEFISG
jgi:hypothetical protein